MKTELNKNFLSGFLTKEQMEAISSLAKTLSKDEIAELKAAGERLFGNVKTEEDIAKVIAQASSGMQMPEIKSERLRQAVGSLASKMASEATKSGSPQAATAPSSKPHTESQGAVVSKRRKSVRKKK